ncbi:GDP-L-fucose synthase [Methylophilaceae bacterium]|nr:GDP-L-fucose synthase [Methylophilaceae bacterium]
MYFVKSAKIYVAGHRGLAGSAICRELIKQGYENIITRTHQELDLEDQKKTEEFICDTKPDMVFLAAAKVGGIHANNTYPVEFLMCNLAIQSNVIKASHKANVQRLIFLGSSCIYPKNCPQPIKEEYLLTSELEPTNRPYALAKIAGIEMCWTYNRQFNTQYLAAMPTNLYGPNDNYHLENSHVLPALIRKIHEATLNNLPSVEIWGSGIPKREFLHSDDLASALVFLMNLNQDKFKALTNSDKTPLINIGTGSDQSIINLAQLLKDIVGFDGDFKLNTSKPDGTLRKVLSVERINNLGWTSKISIKEGLIKTYRNYLDILENV